MRPLIVLLRLWPTILAARYHAWRLRRRRRPIERDARRVLYLASFWPGNAGYEYRVARWADALMDAGFEVDVDCVFDHDQFWSWVQRNDWRLYVVPARRRLKRILESERYGTVVVAREVLLWNDYGNLFLERLLLTLHPDAVLDIDDDLAAAKGEPKATGWYGRLLAEHPAKFTASLGMYRRFIVGSGYLQRLVLDRGGADRAIEVVQIPTCVDYEREPPRSYGAARTGPLVIGWIGGTGNLHELDAVAPSLRQLASEVELRLLVISGRPYYLPGVEVENVQWNMDDHPTMIRRMDVGIMPLRDTPAARGKCGLKLLQYMGLGVVALATAVTANRDIVTDGVDGFLVEPEGNWYEALVRVLEHEARFAEIGCAARETVLSRYSFQVHREAYVDFIAPSRQG